MNKDSKRLYSDDKYLELQSLKNNKNKKSRFNVSVSESREPIAIIGMSGRYPQSKNIHGQT